VAAAGGQSPAALVGGARPRAARAAQRQRGGGSRESAPVGLPAIGGAAPRQRWGGRPGVAGRAVGEDGGEAAASAYRTAGGEDAAAFALEEQDLSKWVKFGVLTSTVLGALYVAWINPTTGFADEYVDAIEAATGGSPEGAITLMLGIFALAHSGLAGLRQAGEQVIGERAWRVMFALVSLPLAICPLVYFINHRYDGAALWDLHAVPGMHAFVWVTTFISFLFLYPSTFNLLEIAAVEKPKVHLWETGVMRITRHPQLFGQGLWCFAHTLWIGNAFTLWTSVLLMAHHVFGAFHGDRRLRSRYGDAFEEVKARTSIVPFAAILDGRQALPPDYWREFARGPYALIVGGTLAAYAAHPLMQGAAFGLGW